MSKGYVEVEDETPIYRGLFYEVLVKRTCSPLVLYKAVMSGVALRRLLDFLDNDLFEWSKGGCRCKEIRELVYAQR